VTGLAKPHGLALYLDGSVLVTDQNAGGRIIDVVAP
jgi:hypothetical protein